VPPENKKPPAPRPKVQTWLPPWVRGILAIVATASTAWMILDKIEIPGEWWLVVASVNAFYFGTKG